MSQNNWHRKCGKHCKNRHPRGKSKSSTFLNDRAVSDVVGNLLMVSITVVMAAIVAVAIFGMKPPADVPHVSYKIQINGTNYDLMHMGGEQVQVSDLKFMSGGGEVFITTDSQINNTGIWKIGKTITLNTTNSDIMIVHIPSQELVQ